MVEVLQMENIIFTSEVAKAIIDILESDQKDFTKVFTFLEKCLKKNLLIPSSFAKAYADLQSKFRKNDGYFDILLQLVTKYDQVDYQGLLDKLPKYISDNSNTYSSLLSILSHRNLNFSSVLPSLLDHIDGNPEIHKSVWAILSSTEKVPEETCLKILEMTKESDWQMVQIICSSESNLSKKFLKALFKSLSSGQLTKQKLEIVSILKQKGIELPSEFESVSKLGKLLNILGDPIWTYAEKYDAVKEVAEAIEEQKESLEVDQYSVNIIMNSIKEHGDTKLSRRLFNILIEIAEKDGKILKFIDWGIAVSAITYQKLEKFVIRLIKISIENKIQIPPGVLSKTLWASDQDEVLKLLQSYRDANGEFDAKDTACQQFLSVSEWDSIKSKEELNDFINMQNFRLPQKAIQTLKRSLKNGKVSLDVMRILCQKIYQGDDISSAISEYIAHIPESGACEFIAPLIIKEKIPSDHLHVSQREDSDGSSATISDKVFALLSSNELSEALKLIRLACLHHLFFEEIENKLCEIALSEEIDQKLRIDAASTYAMFKEQVEASGKDKNSFEFDKDKEKQIVKLLTKDTEFKHLKRNKLLTVAMQCLGISTRINLKLNFKSIDKENDPEEFVSKLLFKPLIKLSQKLETPSDLEVERFYSLLDEFGKNNNIQQN